jgi:hypothetical protein
VVGRVRAFRTALVCLCHRLVEPQLDPIPNSLCNQGLLCPLPAVGAQRCKLLGASYKLEVAYL